MLTLKERASSRTIVSKIVMLGDAAVGKTALVHRFVRQSFGGSYKMTMGLDLSIKELHFPEATVRIQLWDMGGQKSFQPLRFKFYHGTQAAILVYDLTRPQTLYNLQLWLKELEANGLSSIPFVVLGNKADLEELCIIPEHDETLWYLGTKGKTHYLCSAKTGHHVEDAFEFISTILLNQYLERETKEELVPTTPIFTNK